MLNRLCFYLVLLVAFGLISPAAHAQTTIYVDADAAPGDCSNASSVSGLDGSSWDCAYPALQDAFDEANANPGTDYAIWVAAGTYYPDADNVDQISGDDNGSGGTEHAVDNAAESFTLTRDGVEVLGGFDGTETQRSGRDPSTNIVRLSGDVAEDDDPFEPNVDSDGDPNTPNQTDHIVPPNATHVLDFDGTGSGADITSATVLDGVQVRFGLADGSDAAATGGGLLCRGTGSNGVCNPTLRDVTFEGNRAGSEGGAVTANGKGGEASPTISGSTFEANSSGSVGGALYLNADEEGRSTPSIMTTTVRNNTAIGGGGLYIQVVGGNNSAGGEVGGTMSGLSFRGNTANIADGAIRVLARAGGTVTPTIKDTDFSANESGGRAGAVELVSVGTASDGTPSTVSPTFENGTTFSGNTASGGQGGALLVGAFSGAIASPQIDGGSFSQNEAPGGRGGAISVLSDSTDANGNPSTADPSITGGTTFSENTAGPQGGALFIQAREGGATTPNLDNVEFSDPRSVNNAGRGGAIFVLADTTDDAGNPSVADPTITNATFTGLSVGDRGGAVFVEGNEGGEAKPSFSDVTFTDNKAGAGGGAIEVLGDGTDNNGTPGQAAPTMTGVEFERNDGGSEGGALVNRTQDGGTAEPSVINALFVGNESGNGGAIVNKSGAPSGTGTATPTLTNVTVTGNTASGAGGALFNQATTSGSTAEPTLTNVILWNNTSGGRAEVAVAGGTPSISYSIVEGGCPSGTNCSGNLLNKAPQFAGENSGAGPDNTFGTSDDDLRLQGPGSGGGASPAIDAGDNSAISASTDLGGTTRKVDVGSVSNTGDGSSPIVDIGAYESSGSPLPVELAAFDGTQTGEQTVRLRWTTAAETNNAAFQVQHRRSEGADEAWTTVGRVEGSGTTTQPKSYRFVVEDLAPGTHRFRLRQVDLDGAARPHDPIIVEVGMTQPLRLSAPSPNPVRQRATLSFAVRDQTEVTVALYDVLGRRVRTLYRGTPPAEDRRQLHLAADDLTSGVYLLRLRADGRTKTRRVTIVR